MARETKVHSPRVRSLIRPARVNYASFHSPSLWLRERLLLYIVCAKAPIAPVGAIVCVQVEIIQPPIRPLVSDVFAKCTSLYNICVRHTHRGALGKSIFQSRRSLCMQCTHNAGDHSTLVTHNNYMVEKLQNWVFNFLLKKILTLV